MKKLILLLFALLIISKSPQTLPVCNIQTAKQAIPPRIFAEVTSDPKDQNPLLTRFLHNKLGIYGSEFTRCYFNALDPVFIYQSTSLLGLLAIGYFIYKSSKEKKWIPLLVFLIIPALPIFNSPTIMVVYALKLFAIIGLLLLAKIK